MDWISLLVFATPVALAALGETVGQRSGVLNIGLEGTMLLGAYLGMVVSLHSGSPWLGVVAAACGGLASAMVLGGLCVGLAADQVVAGTGINLLALGITGALFRGEFGQSGQLLSVPKLPTWQGLDAISVGTVMLACVLAVLFARSGWGLVVRASGEEPDAVEAAGFSSTRVRFGALAIGGVLGGIAGAYLSLGIAGSFAENMTAGRGFVAIAMVTFGRWNPIGVLAAAAGIGYLDSLQYTFQSRGSALPFQLFLALPYLAALAVLVVAGRGRAAPAALGVPYRRGR
ncbi:MAG: ABC transporter permease [Fimbriimonadaceae bacterium]|nr:ABC transporter permease [Chthonomonadaceae bacterium]MCO5296850.1 ABC transporter permease [Fimbriimonadaceae bacterium]